MSKYLDDYKKKLEAEKAKDPGAFKKKYKSAPPKTNKKKK